MKKFFLLNGMLVLCGVILTSGVAWSAAGGSVSGNVTYAGPAAAPKAVEITKDVKICGKADHFDTSLLVSKDKGLANVVVSVVGVEGGRGLESMGASFSIDQNGCKFIPHVSMVPAGSTLEIKNSDGILHNIHTSSELNKAINKAQPRFLKVLKVSFDKAEVVKVACDVHNWMTGYIVVADHPFHAVTDEDGNFEIADIPDGSYAVEYWHETLGKQTGKVTVAGGAATTSLEFPAQK